MAFIENKFNFDGEAITKILTICKNLINQPKWLITLLILVVIGGGIYFGVFSSHKVEKQSIEYLYEEIDQINELLKENLKEDEYHEDLIYIITEIKLLQQEETQSYKDELLELDLFIDFIKKYHPNDPIINDLNSMKSRLEVNHETYSQHYEYVMKQLNKTFESDSIK